MNVQGMPPISASANNTSVVGRPPMLGAQVPGTTGGLPAQAGLSVAKNPMAEQLQSYGRNGDSMLVHMTPGEVGGLQQLAMAMGGSLSINPETGLPEANFLKKLLPTLLGAGLSFIPGVGPLLAAGIVGGGQTLLTGDINKGLMAGLQAFGGASLGGALAPGAAGGAATKSLALASKTAAAPELAIQAANPASVAGALGKTTLAVPGSTLPAMAAPNIAGATAAKTGLAGFGQRFGVEAARGLGGAAAKYAPYAAGYGLLNAASEASTPTLKMPEEEKSNYKGPYLPQPRKVRFQTPEQMRESGGAEFSYFEDANPYPGFMPAPGMAEGGLAALPAAGDFQATLDFFNRSPGAITASMYPTGTPAGGAGEKAYTFARGNPPPAPGTTGPNSSAGTGGEMLTSFLSNLAANYGGANAADLANMFGGRMTSEIAPNSPPDMSMANSLPGTNLDAVKVSGQGVMPDFKLEDLRINPVDMSNPVTYSPLPGTTIPGADVSGDGVMPDFKLDPLRINPVEMPKINVSSDYGTSNSMGGYKGEFSGPSPFAPTPAPAPTPPVDTGFNLGLSPGYAGEFSGPSPFAPTPAPAPTPPVDTGFNLGLSPGYSGGYSGYGGEFGGSSPFSSSSSFSNSDPFGGSSPFGGMSSIYSGEFGGPSPFSSVFKDPEEFEELKARGGSVNMKDGSFVVDARTVSELGNGSSNAGIEHLARMGGRPVRGGGDGVSDSVPARIGRHQKARVARDEVIFSPEAVRRLGAGSHSKGTKKLYALMDKAHKARKKAGRGQDTKVAKGLGGLA